MSCDHYVLLLLSCDQTLLFVCVSLVTLCRYELIIIATLVATCKLSNTLKKLIVQNYYYIVIIIIPVELQYNYSVKLLSLPVEIN